MQNPSAGTGLFSLFGMTPRKREWLTGLVSRRLGVTPAVIPCPNGDCGFCYTNQGEVEETGESVFLRLGFLRAPDGARLTIDESMEQGLTPRGFRKGSISGNGYLVRFHKLEPRISIFMTVLATSQVYYVPWEGGVLCATDLRALLRLTGGAELNEEAVPLHIMFRILPGPMTYFKHVCRMFPGQTLSWDGNALEIRRTRDMHAPAGVPAYDRLDSAVHEEYFERLSATMGLYVREIERRKGRIVNTLSGGVDSSLIQLLLRQQAPGEEAGSSISFTFEARGFQFEVGYARQASGLLGTRHTFVGVQDRDYPDLLVQTIETLAQPMVMAENDPGHMVLARHLAAGSPARHHVFTGQGADVLQGMDLEECTTGLGPLRYALRETWRLFGIPIFRKKLGGLPDVWRYLFTAGTYRSLRVPPALFDPVNRVAIPYTSFETPRHFLGDRVVLDCLEYRLGLAEDVFPGRTLAERLHHIDMFTLGYGPAVAFEALFAASNQVLIPFYFDQDVVRLANSVSPEVRYRHNGEVKPIPKSILRLKSLGELVHQRKGSSGFWRDFQSWMMTGMLREMVHSIERPGFISRRDFASLVGNKVPYGYDLVWPLLTYDIFRKRVARRYSPPGPGQAGS